MSLFYPHDIEQAYPAWHAWIGVNGVYYARRLLSSPPIVVTAPDPVTLVTAIRAVIAEISGPPDLEPGDLSRPAPARPREAG
jgi:hypothetical protein